MNVENRLLFKSFIIIFSVTIFIIIILFIVYNANVEETEFKPGKVEIPSEVFGEDLVNIELENCLKEEHSDFILSDSILEKQEYLEDLSGEYAIKYTELYDNNNLISYNNTKDFYGESTIKLPFAIYIYELAKEDPSILDKELVMQPSQYYEDTGVMQFMDLTVPYTIRDLVYYMVKDSDNIAFFMLRDEFGIEGTQEYWSNYGATTPFTGWDRFGITNADDLVIYMERMYEIYLSEDEHFDLLLEASKKAGETSYLNEIFDEDIYYKYGGDNYGYHEFLVTTGDRPYVVSALSVVHTLDDYPTFMRDIATNIKYIHDNYWIEKENYCNIKLNIEK